MLMKNHDITIFDFDVSFESNGCFAVHLPEAARRPSHCMSGGQVTARERNELATHEDRDQAEFVALIRGQGWRFRGAFRARCALWRFVHQPDWSRAALTVAYAFGASSTAICSPTRTSTESRFRSGATSPAQSADELPPLTG